MSICQVSLTLCIVWHALLWGYVFCKCTDVNECNEPRQQCVGNAQCVNTPGSFVCECPDGYKLASNKRVCRGNRSYCFITIKTYGEINIQT